MPIFNKRWGCRLKELKGNQKFRKPSPAKDSAGLAALAGMMNTFAGVTAPKEPEGLRPVAAAIQVAPKLEEPTRAVPATSPTAAPAVGLTRVFLTGRLKAGKDHIAEQAGCKIFALADPLYFVAEWYFGKQPKDATRAFLQTVGQWGRGTVDANHPLTPERAMFTQMVRAQFSLQTGGMQVRWDTYGNNENIWLDSLIARMAAEPVGSKIAVSGVRFQNEYARLQAEGFVPFHVMTSAPTWTARLKQVGLTPESAECKNSSEYLAASLDQSVMKTLSQHPQGNKLRCVWSDGEVLTPSRRLLTVKEFCALFPKAP